MWIRKIDRDLKKGVDSPMPTQVVSNEEFIPRPQNEPEAGRSTDRRDGRCTRAQARHRSPRVHGDLDGPGHLLPRLEQGLRQGLGGRRGRNLGAAAIDEKYPKGEYFIIDVQAHFTNGIALEFRNMEFVKNMGFNLRTTSKSYSFKNFVKEMYFDSETSMVVISGVPGREKQRDAGRQGARRRERARAAHPAELADVARAATRSTNSPARSARSARAISRRITTGTRRPTRSTRPRRIEQMERELKQYRIDSWKWYCHTDPARTGGGFQLDDDNAQWFIRGVAQTRHEAHQRAQGLLVPVAHARPSRQPEGRREGRAAQPGLQLHRLPLGDQARPERAELSKTSNKYDPTTGDFEWHNDADGHQEAQSEDEQRLSARSGASSTAGDHGPGAGMHGMGKNIKTLRRRPRHLGHRLPVVGIAAVGDRCVQALPDHRRVCEKFGYKKITNEDKAKIFGLNAAKLYGVDVKAKRNALPADALEQAEDRLSRRAAAQRQQRRVRLGSRERLMRALAAPVIDLRCRPVRMRRRTSITCI